MRFLQRLFLNVAGVEVEVCTDSGRYFVRHHVYWSIAHGKKNPDPEKNCIVYNLKLMVNNRIPTVRWAGHDFKFERIAFDDGMEVETVLLPLKMFEDFIHWHASSTHQRVSETEYDKLSKCLENISLENLIKS